MNDRLSPRDAMAHVAAEVGPDDFYRAAHRAILAAALEEHRQAQEHFQRTRVLGEALAKVDALLTGARP